MPNYSLLNAYARPMFLKCQNFYTLGVEEYFTKTGDFTWRVSDCEELVGDKFLNRFMTDYFTQKIHSVLD